MTHVKRPTLYRIFFVSLLVIFSSVFSSSLLALVNPCDTTYVNVDTGGDFIIAPSNDKTGMTDTVNIQCANNAIVYRPYHALKLQNGNFFIKQVYLNCPSTKACTFSGTSRAGTTLEIVNNSINCQGNRNQNIATGGLTFRGNILVQFMKVKANSPCMGDGRLPGLVVFTGAPAVMGNTCENSILFGELNRVDLVATSSQIDNGVLVSSQGRFLGGNLCQRGLSGSFTSTRSSVDGPDIGASISMQSGARIGLDYFESTNSSVGIWIINSFAVAEINFCKIDANGNQDGTSFGILVTRGTDAPVSNTANISQCTFDLGRGPGMRGAIGVSTFDSDRQSKVSVVISSSTFNYLGPNTSGIEINGTSNCTISNNRFIGDGKSAISLFFGSYELSGCTVTANKLAGFTSSFVDLYAGFSTFDNIFGPHPGTTILDEGCNYVLDNPDGGCALSGAGPSKNGKPDDRSMVTSARSPGRHFLPEPGQPPLATMPD